MLLLYPAGEPVERASEGDNTYRSMASGASHASRKVLGDEVVVVETVEDVLFPLLTSDETTNDSSAFYPVEIGLNFKRRAFVGGRSDALGSEVAGSLGGICTGWEQVELLRCALLSLV